MEEKGTFYAVAVGPGSADLLTVRALRVLTRCPVIAAPQTDGGRTAALDILRSVMPLEGKTLLPLSFSMSRDPCLRENAHRRMTEAILRHLAEGRDVGMVCLGDTAFYASVGYLAGPIRGAGYRAEFIPGVTSFSAAAAALGTALAEGERPVHIIPCLSDAWRDALDLPGTKILLKPGTRLPAILDFLKKTGRERASALAVNCGMEGEELIAPFTELPRRESYFSLVIVKEEPTW